MSKAVWMVTVVDHKDEGEVEEDFIDLLNMALWQYLQQDGEAYSTYLENGVVAKSAAFLGRSDDA